jgi:hypothetical protein
MATSYVLRSSDSNTLYPSNEPFDFRVVLPKWLVFEGQWTIELSEFYATNISKTKTKELFIYCDICDTSVVGKQYRTLLRHVVLESNKNQIFMRPYPVPLRIQEFENIRFDLRDKDDNPATFLSGEVILTLFFRPLVTPIQP